MMSMLSKNPIPFDRPANYQVNVLGPIDPSMSDLLGGMTISPDTTEAGPPVTTLEGELRDQAALAGVLNALYELHLTVLLVKRLEIWSLMRKLDQRHHPDLYHAPRSKQVFDVDLLSVNIKTKKEK
jgi:hypothetical protein